jgi:hypothetical protein
MTRKKLAFIGDQHFLCVTEVTTNIGRVLDLHNEKAKRRPLIARELGPLVSRVCDGIKTFAKSDEKKACAAAIREEFQRVYPDFSVPPSTVQAAAVRELALKIQLFDRSGGSRLSLNTKWLHYGINQGLRSVKSVSAFTEAAIEDARASAVPEPLRPLLELLLDALRAQRPLRDFPLTVWRGAKIPKVVLAELRKAVGKVVTFPAFSTFTAAMHEAAQFPKWEVNAEEVKVLFELDSINRPSTAGLAPFEGVLVPSFALHFVLRVGTCLIDGEERDLVKLIDLPLLPQYGIQWQLGNVRFKFEGKQVSVPVAAGDTVAAMMMKLGEAVKATISIIIGPGGDVLVPTAQFQDLPRDVEYIAEGKSLA